MKNQLIQLVRILINEDEPVTSTKLADMLNISPRSVKNYIQEINGISDAAIQSSHHGYTIDKDKARNILESSQSTIPQTAKERETYVINRLLQKPAVNVNDLCDEMFISYSTFKTSLPKIRAILDKNDLELIVQGDVLLVKGLEKNKRKLLSGLLYSESRNSFVNYESMNKAFPGIHVEYIKDVILDEFRKHHYFINDYSLENLVLHVAISIDRIRNGYVTTQQNVYEKAIRSHEHELAEDIIHRLEKHYQIVFNASETTEFTLLILSRASNLDYQTVTMDNIREYIGDDVYNLTQDIINEFCNYFYIDLSQSEFFVRFALHIKNVLIRANSDYFSKNPLTKSIKQNCPLIYDAAVNAARIIHDRTGIYLNDDEIAYIAFHIGGALEIQNTLKSKLNVSLFCPNYYNLSLQMSEKITSRYGDSIVIDNLIRDEEEIKHTKGDLIISTMPVDTVMSVPVIVVSPFLNDQEMHAIGQKIDDIRKEKKRNTFRQELTLLVRPELFIKKKQMKSKDEVIHVMAETLVKEGYATKNFEEEVKDRDAMSSVAFGNFAVPHAMRMHEKKTGMAVMILDKPVQWNDQKVQLVMMLCFNRNERYIFNQVFEPITMILTEPGAIKNVLQAKNYQEFIDSLVNML